MWVGIPRLPRAANLTLACTAVRCAGGLVFLVSLEKGGLTGVACDFTDELLFELLLNCRVFGSVCAQVDADPRPGPFNSPYGAFVDEHGTVSGWISANHRDGLTYDELIDAVRLEAMARSASGKLAGAALMVWATDDSGRDALIVQAETRRSKVTLLYEFDDHSSIIDEPTEVEPILPEGLCFFAPSA